MSTEIIDIARSYFLSVDEIERSNILTKADGYIVGVIRDIELKFNSNISIEEIASIHGLESFHDELRDIQLEYFIGLAEILQEGRKNKAIELLLDHNNLLFKEVYSFFEDQKSFESELKWAIKYAKRDEFKAEYDRAQIMQNEGVFFLDEEVKYDITQNERLEDIEPSVYSRATFSISRIRLWPYAVAAALVTIVVGTGLNYYYQASTQTDTMVKHTKHELPRLPNLIQTQEVTQSVWQDESIVGFSKKTDSIKIKITGLSTQIDTLQKILEKGSKESNSEYRQLDNIIISQIDSLQALVNTYTYFRAGKTLYLNLARKVNPIRAYVLDDKNGSNLYIRLQEQYFLIIDNTKPYKLSPITNQLVIQELKRVEFLNE